MFIIYAYILIFIHIYICTYVSIYKWFVYDFLLKDNSRKLYWRRKDEKVLYLVEMYIINNQKQK